MSEMVSDIRKWDELIPDALALIFKKLSLCEVLTEVPAVCKSWQRVVLGPHFWQEIDLEEWSDDSDPEIIDKMLKLLIPRSCGSLRKLSVSGLEGTESFNLIANHAQSLKELQLIGCEVGAGVIQMLAPKLSNTTSLNMSFCSGIGAPELQAIGENCKSLTSLNLRQLSFKQSFGFVEAKAIASTMPNLKNLVLAFSGIDTLSFHYIIENCKHLESLNVNGCGLVELDKDYLKRFPNLKISGPNDGKKHHKPWLDDSSSDYEWASDNCDYYDDMGFEYDDYDDYRDSAADLYYPGMFENEHDTDHFYAALLAEELADDLDYFL